MAEKKKRKREVYTGLTDLEKWQVGQARGRNVGELEVSPEPGVWLERVRGPESLAKVFEGKAAGVLSASVKERKRKNMSYTRMDARGKYYSYPQQRDLVDVFRNIYGRYKNRNVSPSREATSRASILRAQAGSLRNPDVGWPDVRGKK
tara:strand:+ start:430 stop:873 length:444 start_codon:yes stop_codon:yes gene_type:complete